MGFVEAVKSCYSKYVQFSGRAPRSEYWWFTLFILLAYLACLLIGVLIPVLGAILLVVLVIGSILPSISVTVRRLHDSGRSGWWYWISIVPIIGLVLFYFMIIKGTEGANDYGSDPLEDLSQRFS